MLYYSSSLLLDGENFDPIQKKALGTTKSEAHWFLLEKKMSFIGYDFYSLQKAKIKLDMYEKEVQETSLLKFYEKFLLVDGSHLSTLRIDSAKLEDSGKYICVVFRKGEKFFHKKNSDQNMLQTLL